VPVGDKYKTTLFEIVWPFSQLITDVFKAGPNPFQAVK